MKKIRVCLYRPGSLTNSIQGCYPTTTQCGGFELLSFDPGPIHLSLDNLVVRGYPLITILTLSLVRTSYQHGDPWERTPDLKPSTRPSSQAAELQRHATTSNCGPICVKLFMFLDVARNDWWHKFLITTIYHWIFWFDTLDQVKLRQIKNFSCCSSPRKSLVKGERFMRYEENSEITKNGLTGIYEDGRHKSLHQCKLIDLKFSVKYFLLNRMFFCFIYSMQIKTTKCIFCMITAKKIDLSAKSWKKAIC